MLKTVTKKDRFLSPDCFAPCRVSATLRCTHREQRRDSERVPRAFSQLTKTFTPQQAPVVFLPFLKHRTPEAHFQRTIDRLVCFAKTKLGIPSLSIVRWKCTSSHGGRIGGGAPAVPHRLTSAAGRSESTARPQPSIWRCICGLMRNPSAPVVRRGSVVTAVLVRKDKKKTMCLG